MSLQAIFAKKKKVILFILCTVWLSFSLAFFLMITEGGDVNMELEIGTLIALQGRSALLFTRSVIGFGVLMIVLFILKRRIGFILAIIWSIWWGVNLSTALFNPSSFSDRITIFLTVFLFAASAWLAVTRLKAMR